MTTAVLSVLANSVSGSKVAEMQVNPNKVYFPNLGGDNIFTNGINLNQAMFTIPGTDFKIYWYGFLIALGILLAMVYGFKKMRSFGVDPDRATTAVIGGLIGAIVGARLYYVLFSLDTYIVDGKLDIMAILSVRDGGLAIYGGIIGALLVGGIILKIKKVRLMAMFDVVAPCFLIGQCIGRWGNFFNQEAFGSNTSLPWGMMSAKTISYLQTNADAILDKSGVAVNATMPVHPCFLYESIWCLIGFILLHIYSKHRKFDGEVFLMYIGWYGLGRFFIEMLRTDSLFIANIKVSELVAGACVLAAIILIFVFRSVTKRDENYKLFVDTDQSKLQLAEYDAIAKYTEYKKELKKKIKDAKLKGEGFADLEAEYEEKYGKNAKLPTVDAESVDTRTEEEKYQSILAEDEAEVQEDTVDSNQPEVKEKTK